MILKAKPFLLTISVSLTSFSAFSAWVDIGTYAGIKYLADTKFLPISINGYQQYKEVKIKGSAIDSSADVLFEEIGESVELITWIDCKNQKYIIKARSFFNRDGSLKQVSQPDNREMSITGLTERNNSPLPYLCKNSTLLKQHPSLIRDSMDSIDLMNQRTVEPIKQKTPQMSKMEYNQILQNMDKKASALSSHRSRLHPSRDPENPDILRKDTPANRLAINKKELELTCQKIKILKEQERFVMEQNFYSKHSDLVPIIYTLKSERIRVVNLVDFIKSKGVKANICY